jgi:hypothetical protein
MYRTSKTIKYTHHLNSQSCVVDWYPIHQGIASCSLLIVAIALLCCSTAWAEENNSIPPDNNNISVINGSSDVSGNRGTVTVNVSAGDINSQANVGIIAVGVDAGKNITQPIIEQKIKKIRNQTPDKAVASITGNAFSNSSGWTAVNQISGQANMQANIMVISVGGEYEVDAVGDDLLAQSFSGASVSGSPSANQHHERAASIDDSALRGMTGVVQVNQTAGARNATSNTFVFQVTGN